MGSRIRSMSAVTQEPRTSTFRSGTWTCSTRQQGRLDCAMPYTKAVMAGAGHVGQTAKETRLARTHREGSSPGDRLMVGEGRALTIPRPLP